MPLSLEESLPSCFLFALWTLINFFLQGLGGMGDCAWSQAH